MPSVFVMRASATAVAITDTFNRANQTPLGTPSDGGTPWVVNPADSVFSIVSNKATLTTRSAAASGAFATFHMSCAGRLSAGGLQDITITNSLTASTSSLIFVGADSTFSSGYWVQYTGAANSLTLFRRTSSGVTTSLGTATNAAWTGGSATLRMTYDPSTFNVQFFLNGTLKFNHTGTGLLGTYTAFYNGFGSNSVYGSTAEAWDDLSMI